MMSTNTKNTQQVQNLNLQIYGHQVSGKSPKFTDKSQRYIYKSYSQAQGKFFQYLSHCGIGHKSYLLSKFIPQYMGVFTQSEILHSQDFNNCTHQHSNLPNQTLQPVKQIIQEELLSLKTVSQRKQWIEHINSRTVFEKNQKFLKLKNLTYGYKYPNVMDLKLGIKKPKNKVSSMKKLQKNTTKSHGFRINGLSVRQFDNNKNAQERFMSKYYCQKIGLQHLNKHLAFFLFDGKKIHVELLNKFIQQLKQLILGFLSFTDIQFQSSSLYLAYDAYDPTKFTINFIDFDKYHEKPGIDESVQFGLKSCLRHFIEIKDSLRNIQSQLINKQLMYFHENHDVVPKEKVAEYQKRSRKNIEADQE